MSLAWVVLIVAGACECAWAIGLKYVDGLRHPAALVFVVVFMAASFGLLTYSLRTLPVGTAYAVWTGIGAAGTAALGMILLGEPATAGRIACLAVVVVGIAGLKILS